MVCNLYFDDDLMTDTFGDYFYIMKYYVYYVVWMSDCLFIAFYSYSLKSLPLRSCPMRDKAGRQTMGSITNYLIYPLGLLHRNPYT